MRRLFIPLSVLVVVLLGIVATRPSIGTDAQEATIAHPVIGAWLGDVDANDPANAPSLLMFHDDGTYLQTDPDGSTGVGVWDETGPNTVLLTALFHGQDEMENFGGTATVRAAVEVDASGNMLTAEYTLDFTGADGMSTGEMGPGTATAERIVIEEMGTPTAPMDIDDGGTPTAG